MSQRILITDKRAQALGLEACCVSLRTTAHAARFKWVTGGQGIAAAGVRGALAAHAAATFSHGSDLSLLVDRAGAGIHVSLLHVSARLHVLIQ